MVKDEATGQGMQAVSPHYERTTDRFSFRGSIRNHPCQHLDCSQKNDLKLLTFGTVKMVHLCWLKPLSLW